MNLLKIYLPKYYETVAHLYHLIFFICVDYEKN